MTELIAETKPTMKIPKRFETLAEPTVSSLPRKPVVRALPETNRNRLKVNLEMKNRYRGRLPAAPTMAAPPPRAVAPVTRYNYKILSSFEDEKPTPMTSFGMKQEEENKGLYSISRVFFLHFRFRRKFVFRQIDSSESFKTPIIFQILIRRKCGFDTTSSYTSWFSKFPEGNTRKKFNS